MGNSAFWLLVVTGSLLGLTLPLSKLAGMAGIGAFLWAFLISFGAGGILLVVLLLRDGPPSLNSRKLRYFSVTAAISYAIPNILTFTVIPHLGAGYTGIMYTLSPVFTLLLSIAFSLRKPNRLGMVGIAIGFVGAALVALTRGEAGQPAGALWICLGLLIPLSLASGNIYRTYDWPADSGPIELAVGSHLAAAILLLLVTLATGSPGSIAQLSTVPWLALAQVAAAAGMFAFFFRLQAVGGPVYLSQIGYVAAAVGLLFGTFMFGERYEFMTWAGAVIIATGVAMTTKAQAAA